MAFLNAKQHWIILRLTAVINIPLVFWLVYNLVDHAGADYTVFTTWLAQPLNTGLMILLLASVFYHAALGAHEIIEDYVHDKKLNRMSVTIKVISLALLSLICVASVIKVAFV